MEKKENKKEVEEEGVFEEEEKKDKAEEEMAKEPKKEDEPEGEKEPEKKEEDMAKDEPEKKDEDVKEDGSKDEKLEDKENTSDDKGLDMEAILAALGKYSYGEIIKDEFSKQISEVDFSKVCGAMFEHIKVVNEELKALRAFKNDIDKKQFDFEVASTMKDIESHSSIPQDKKDFLLEESKKFNLENVDEWKNFAKAEAFSYTIKDENEEKTFRFANPWLTKGSKKTSVWEA